MSADPKRKLNTDEAAKHLGVTHRVLADLRSKGGGPPYFKIGGRCIYQLGDLDAWLATKRATGTPKNASEPRPIGRPTPLDAYA